MRSSGKFMLLVLLLIGLLALSAAAQEDEGGTVIYGIVGDTQDESNFIFSPYYCNALKCAYISGMMNIHLLGIDQNSGWYDSGHYGVVDSWEFSNNNQVLTLHLRDDLYWSDGVPITSADVLMSYEISSNPESSYNSRWINAVYENIEAPDDKTIVITFNEGNCSALNTVDSTLYVLPAHIYRDLIDEVGYAGLMNHEWFTHPSIVSGPYKWGEMSEDKTITLLGNENYADGTLNLPRFVQKIVPDEETRLDMFWAGDVNILTGIPPRYRAEFVDAAAAGEVQIYEFPSNDWYFMAMNQADPTNPQPAVDENGNRIEQGLHPVFGDKQVRQAMAYAIDVDTIIEEAHFGYAQRISTHIPPGSWALNYELSPIPYEPDVALSMLAEAGWLPENPILPASEDNKLVCQDCLYAREVDAAFNGSYLEFELLANQFQPERVIEGTLIQEQLAQIGITVDLQLTDFPTLLDAFSAQTYDAVIAGFFSNFPHDPQVPFFDALEDQPGVGWNDFSFYNEAYFALDETVSNIPGCGLTERIEIYRQMQVIMQDEMPVVFLYTGTGMMAARNEIEGFNPYPYNPFWNIGEWIVHESD